MKYSSSFTHDIKFGEEAEDWVKSLFTGNFKVEVKSDRKALDTGNLYVEVFSRGKPSGISTSDADVWIFFLNHITLCVKTEILKKIVKHFHEANEKKFKRGGDNDTSKGVLIPIKALFYHSNKKIFYE
jgi:hypothetical protein